MRSNTFTLAQIHDHAIALYEAICLEKNIEVGQVFSIDEVSDPRFRSGERLLDMAALTQMCQGEAPSLERVYAITSTAHQGWVLIPDPVANEAYQGRPIVHPETGERITNADRCVFLCWRRRH